MLGKAITGVISMAATALVGSVVTVAQPPVAAKIQDVFNIRPRLAHESSLTPLNMSRAGQAKSSRMITLKGKGPLYSGVNDVYVVVKVDVRYGGYYPQGRPISTSGGRSWQCDISLGSPLESEVGRYRVYLISVPPERAGDLVQYLRLRARTDNTGLSESGPPGTPIGESLSIDRKRASVAEANSAGTSVADNLSQAVTGCVNPYR